MKVILVEVFRTEPGIQGGAPKSDFRVFFGMPRERSLLDPSLQQVVMRA